MEYTTRATNDTKKALEYQSKARKRIQTRDGLKHSLKGGAKNKLYVNLSKFLTIAMPTFYGSYMVQKRNMAYMSHKHLTELTQRYCKRIADSSSAKLAYLVPALPFSSWHSYKGTQKCPLTVKCHDVDRTRFGKCLVHQSRGKGTLQRNFKFQIYKSYQSDLSIFVG